MVGVRTFAISSSIQIARAIVVSLAFAKARQIIHNIGRQLAHALEVPERAYALKTWTADNVDAGDAGKRRQRWSVFRARRAEQGNQSNADRRGGVHQPGVVADHDLGSGEKIDRGPEVGAPAGIAYFRNQRGERLRGKLIVGGSNHPHGVARVDQTSRQGHKMLRRPTLGGPVLGARAEDRHRPPGPVPAHGSLRPHCPHWAPAPAQKPSAASRPGSRPRQQNDRPVVDTPSGRAYERRSTISRALRRRSQFAAESGRATGSAPT